MGQCLSVEIDDLLNHCLCKVDVKPSLFSKRKGSKGLELNSGKIDLFWDLSSAGFGSGAGAVGRVLFSSGFWGRDGFANWGSQERSK